MNPKEILALLVDLHGYVSTVRDQTDPVVPPSPERRAQAVLDCERIEQAEAELASQIKEAA